MTGAVAQIIVDPTNPASQEVVVNEGRQLQLSPLVLDGAGNPLQGVNLSYTSLSPEVATVGTSR